jgi:hypothetical protein
VKHTIHVTQEDIDTKSYGDPCDCPIWHALKREFPDADILVGGYYFSLDKHIYYFPPRLKAASDAIYYGRGRAFWFRFEPVGMEA